MAEIEAWLETDGNSAPKWVWKPAEQSNKERLLRLVEAGVGSVKDAAEELQLTPGAVSKLKKQLQKEGRLKPGRSLALAC